MTNREKFIEVFGDNPQRHNITKSWWDEEYVPPQEPKTEKVIKMRDVTPEERESIDKYIESISKPTGVDFWDLEQEPILNKIRSEVEQYNLRPSNYPCNMISIGTVLQIIDKYRGYSSCGDCEHDGSFGKEFDDTCMQCKSGSNRTESR